MSRWLICVYLLLGGLFGWVVCFSMHETKYVISEVKQRPYLSVPFKELDSADAWVEEIMRELRYQHQHLFKMPHIEFSILIADSIPDAFIADVVQQMECEVIEDGAMVYTASVALCKYLVERWYVIDPKKVEQWAVSSYDVYRERRIRMFLNAALKSDPGKGRELYLLHAESLDSTNGLIFLDAEMAMATYRLKGSEAFWVFFDKSDNKYFLDEIDCRNLGLQSADFIAYYESLIECGINTNLTQQVLRVWSHKDLHGFIDYYRKKKKVMTTSSIRIFLEALIDLGSEEYDTFVCQELEDGVISVDDFIQEVQEKLLLREYYPILKKVRVLPTEAEIAYELIEPYVNRVGVFESLKIVNLISDSTERYAEMKKIVNSDEMQKNAVNLKILKNILKLFNITDNEKKALVKLLGQK